MRLSLLDYARFFAAFSVVVFHYFYSGISNGKIVTIQKTYLFDIASYGHFGVQFFFMISGYVIFFSLKNKDAASFLKSRLKRLYPTYWFAVIFTAFFAYLWGGGTDMAVSLKQILVNLTMLQQFVNVKNVDGVYWTLFYEIIFYAIVFLILHIGNFKKLLAFLIIWPILIIIVNTFSNGFFIFNLYFLFFIIGAMFALLKNGHISKLIALIILLISACAGFYQIYQAALIKDNNLIIVILIYISMLSFFAILNVNRFREINLPRSQDIGGMTYPIYLIHAHFGYLFINKFANYQNQIYIYIILILLVLIFSWILWYVVEVKQEKFWYKLFNLLVRPLSKNYERKFFENEK